MKPGPDRSSLNTRYLSNQHVFQEVLFGEDYIFDTNQLWVSEQPFCNDIRLDLIDRLLVLAQEHCTEFQWQVLQLHLQGKSQIEIGQIFGVEQSNISKCFTGTGRYENGKLIKFEGGIWPKLKKVAGKDEKIQKLLEELQEMYE